MRQFAIITLVAVIGLALLAGIQGGFAASGPSLATACAWRQPETTTALDRPMLHRAATVPARRWDVAAAVAASTQ